MFPNHRSFDSAENQRQISQHFNDNSEPQPYHATSFAPTYSMAKSIPNEPINSLVYSNYGSLTNHQENQYSKTYRNALQGSFISNHSVMDQSNFNSILKMNQPFTHEIKQEKVI